LPAEPASEPEEHQAAASERGADECPLAPAGHERAWEDADPLEEEHTSGKKGEHGDDPNSESDC
jgi:hypothetical protein